MGESSTAQPPPHFPLIIFQNDNALFRIPQEESAVQFHQEIAGIEDPRDYYEDGEELPNFIEPLLPPQVDYEKVGAFINDTTSPDFFKTFRFDPSFSNIMLLMGLMLFTLWVIGMNLLTVIGILRTHRRGHMADLYLVNLATGDTMLGIFVLPLMSTVILIGYFPFNRIVCDLWVFLDYYLIVASSFGMCSLMCNYLWMMSWPETFPIDYKHHILAICVAWIAVNLCWTPVYFNDRLTTHYPQGHCGFSISRNKFFSIYIGVSGFYLPLIISLVCGIWALAGLKKNSGIPLLSLKQSVSIGRRRRSSRLINEVIWTFFKILPDAIIDSIEGGGKSTKIGKGKPHASTEIGGDNGRAPSLSRTERQTSLKELKRVQRSHSITTRSDPKMISQMARDHYPLIVSSLLLFISCRGLFYVYFGVGSLVHDFFPLDLSNGVYWMMHSNAAISPLIHFAFDPELREEVVRLMGLKRNPHRSPVVQPESKINGKSEQTENWNTATVSRENYKNSREEENDSNARLQPTNPTVSTVSQFVMDQEGLSRREQRRNGRLRDMRCSSLKAKVVFEDECKRERLLTDVDVNRKPRVTVGRIPRGTERL